MKLRNRSDGIEDIGKIQVPEGLDEQEHGEQEAEVANEVDDEGFFAGIGGGVLRKVEADEQVGG